MESKPLYNPTYLPVEPYPTWRLVDERGTFKKNKQGKSLTFKTKKEALRCSNT
jgi:hypothetical protein